MSYSYMNRTILLAIVLCVTVTQRIWSQPKVALITSDIENFWQAYDKIVSTNDSVSQYNYLNKLFLSKATPGLKAMMQARDYTAKSYLDAINQRQIYFNSIRSNTLKAKDYANAIAKKIETLKELYPSLKPAQIYFTMGAFRSGGTTMGNMILLGSEIAMADEHLPNLVFSTIHEYIHTQQRTTIGKNLLAQSILEGVAEFLAEQVLSTKSTLPAIAYGKANTEIIKQAFLLQMFNSGNGFWLYSNAQNQFGTRDLGYYVGYAIAESYFNKARVKAKAISEMIELDYDNLEALYLYVDQSGYFSRKIKTLEKEYEESRPSIIATKTARTENTADQSVYKVAVFFSKPMDTRFKSFEMGPLGKDNLVRIKNFIGFSADGRSLEFTAALKPNKQYQIVLGESFRDLNGVRIKPFLIEFKTDN